MSRRAEARPGRTGNHRRQAVRGTAAGTVVGINAFKGIQSEKATGLAAVAGGISEALVTTAIGLFVAIPAVMMFNYLTGRVEAFDVEMDNSSSELIDYFLKRRGMRRS